MSSYVIRQNYSESTNQEDMKRFILDKKIITCPWGGWGQDRENVINGIFNENTSGGVTRKSSGQDRMFVESIKIGDIVVIPFSKKKSVFSQKLFQMLNMLLILAYFGVTVMENSILTIKATLHLDQLVGLLKFLMKTLSLDQD